MCVGNHTCIGVIPTRNAEVNNNEVHSDKIEDAVGAQALADAVKTNTCLRRTKREGRWERQCMCVGDRTRVGVIPTLDGEVNNEKFQRIMKAGQWEHQRMCVGNHTRIGVIPTRNAEVNNNEVHSDKIDDAAGEQTP